MNTEKKVLIVTGAAAGIGRAVVEGWVRNGGRGAALDLEFLDDTVFDDGVLRVECDVISRDSVLAGVRRVREAYGRIDALVNAAGIMRPEPSARMSEQHAMDTFAVHWFGAMWAAQAVFDDLATNFGAIVNVSSVAGISGMPQRAAYNSAKAAIDGMTRTLAVEWAPHGIRVNAVAPGYTRTRMTDSLIEAGKLRVEPIVARTPLRRFAEPGEIAQPILFLLSPAASYITGQILYVDGGLTVDGNWY
jgi:Dehydrogenases with different specificities (related to short-chain alcohol dehydrogenases)